MGRHNGVVHRDSQSCYRAVQAKDARFDGLFFTGVTSTGIYCRCVCTAKTPKAENCRFLDSAAAAESLGFRPCLICRPELAPGRSSVDIQKSHAKRAAKLIEAGILETLDLSQLAERLGISDRHLRRVMVEEIGVKPVEIAQTYRLLTAKRLLTDTQLPIGEIALASGFKSVRRLNTAFQERYSLTPSRLRKQRKGAGGTVISELSYRPPFAWSDHLDFLGHRRIEGVEVYDGSTYLRTVSIGSNIGILKVSHAPDHNRVRLEVSESLALALPKIVARVKRVFDLDANPEAINRVLGNLSSANPGLRLPGAFDGFEAAVRAILGQQISVKFATTLAGRIAAKFGAPIETGVEGLTCCFPSAARIAECTQDEIASCGVIGTRSRAIIALAQDLVSGRLDLSPTADYETARKTLLTIPGVGPWTAEYVCMRALSFPDAFPSQDLGVFKALGTKDHRVATELVEHYRPWRAYAVMHLWRSLSHPVSGDHCK